MSDTSKLVKIFTGSDFLCTLLKGNLEEAGIEAYVKSQNEAARVAGFGMLGISEVYVLESNITGATEILVAFEARQNEEA